MTSMRFDPLRLDVAVFARNAASLAGRWPLAAFERLVEAAHPEARPTAEDHLEWSLRGEWRRGAGLESNAWLHVAASAALRLQCQRCLAPVDTVVAVERALCFVAGEQQAAALDIDSEDDVLALTASLDVRELMEDELLLAMPLVPRHERCPEPLWAEDRAADAPEPAAPPHAFAALKQLKKGAD